MITLNTNVELGVVPTHIRFAGGLVPDERGKFPRNENGELIVVAELRELAAASPVKIQSAQITIFPGVDADDTGELINGIRALGMEVHLILMVGGADPMNPDDEDAVVGMLIDGIEVAKKFGITQIASTSIEAWMAPGATRKEGADFEAAVAQNVKVHCRAAREAGILNSSVENWHIEFLRGGEFQTFTDIGRCWEFVKAANAELGSKLFKILVDAAHCGDSSLSIPENQALIVQIAEAGEMGMFHASSKTTRGCLSTDDGWIGALLRTAAETGKLEIAFVEIFDHSDPALQALRDLDPGFGIDTTDGRTYRETLLDGVEGVARRLNNLVARGYLKN